MSANRGVIAICNQVVGSGKTTLTLELGNTLVQRGNRVLMIDLDPQGGLSAACGADSGNTLTLADLILDGPVEAATVWDILTPIGTYEFLHLAPSDVNLALTELQLSDRLGRERALERLLEPIKDSFTFILIDCPADLGLLTMNALVAAKGLLVPTQLSMSDMRSIWVLETALAIVRRDLNPDLDLVAFVPTAFNAGLAHHMTALEVLKTLDAPTFGPRSSNEAEAVSQNGRDPYLFASNEEVQADLAAYMEAWAKRKWEKVDI